jgi:hypothetical protein
VLAQAAAASEAWLSFLSHTSGPIPATNLAARRAGASSSDGCWSTVEYVGGNDNPPSMPRWVKANNFIATFGSNSTAATNGPECAAKISNLCTKGSEGTPFYWQATPVLVPERSPLTAAQIKSGKNLSPMCFYCQTLGYGTNDKSPGYYVPCGCQRNCVDVSGNLKFTDKMGKTQKLDTCQKYIDAGMVATCNNIAVYHAVLWPSLLGAIAMLYMAYSMINMPLEMNSLLFSVGSNKKEN